MPSRSLSNHMQAQASSDPIHIQGIASMQLLEKHTCKCACAQLPAQTTLQVFLNAQKSQSMVPLSPASGLRVQGV